MIVYQRQGEHRKRNEGIILGRDDERRDADPVQDMTRTGTIVIVCGVVIPAISIHTSP